jgi:hypothetical protein
MVIIIKETKDASNEIIANENAGNTIIANKYLDVTNENCLKPLWLLNWANQSSGHELCVMTGVTDIDL